MQKEELFQILNKYHLRPEKQLGQHYLVDEKVLQTIIEAADIESGEKILEIGAGPGILTQALARAGAEVLAVEFDRAFCHLLQEEFHNWRNVHVLCTDALRLDLSDEAYKKIVANIPYQITNPLLRKILDPKSSIDTAIMLIQKEVAERLMAKPGSASRGIVTIMVEMYGTIEKIASVPPNSFWPPPKVDSTVIKIKKSLAEARDKPSTLDPEPLLWFVKQGFSGKRKILANSLSGSLHLPKDEAAGLIKAAKIDLLARAEDLTLTQWLELFKKFTANLNGSPGSKKDARFTGAS